jgi:hypothetical protein
VQRTTYTPTKFIRGCGASPLDGRTCGRAGKTADRNLEALNPNPQTGYVCLLTPVQVLHMAEHLLGFKRIHRPDRLLKGSPSWKP